MKKKVLVVDDDEGLRDLYEEELEGDGYEVLTAKNGKDALQQLKNGKPDLVVLDIIMPKMDGMEALGRIIKQDGTIPVILHSSNSAYREDLMSWAADAYLLKSTDLTELKEKINELLQQRREKHQMQPTSGRMRSERKRS